VIPQSRQQLRRDKEVLSRIGRTSDLNQLVVDVSLSALIHSLRVSYAHCRESYELTWLISSTRENGVRAISESDIRYVTVAKLRSCKSADWPAYDSLTHSAGL